MLCRVEYMNGGWKQLLALPIRRETVFISKLLTMFVLLALTQVILLLLFILGGFSIDMKDQIPVSSLSIFVVRGWVAALPLATAQLALSLRWHSFGAPLGINIALSLPSILVANSTFGQFYPWAQPMLAMSPADESPIPSNFIFFLILSSFLIFSLLIGLQTIKNSTYN
jgi:lantibiotic transport system permease protein